MYQRNNWSQKEDQVLLKLMKENNIKKWSQIAEIMKKQFQLIGRTGKQCRERWYNTLNPDLNLKNWNQVDSKKLFEYHAIYGNKWTKIATLFGNRSDNSVKNHFYGTIRKSNRIINKYLKQNKKKINVKIIKSNVFSKIICLSQKPSTSNVSLQLILKSKSVLNNLIQIAQSENQQFDLCFLESIVKDILEINKDYVIKKYKKRKQYFSSFNFSLSSQSETISASSIENQLSPIVSFTNKKNQVSENKNSNSLQIFKNPNLNMSHFQNPIIQQPTNYYLIQNNSAPIININQPLCIISGYFNVQTQFYPICYSNYW